MTMVSKTRGYRGRGRFTLRPLGGGRPFELGNVVSLTESIEVERQARQDYQDAAGGELDVQERVTSFTFELNANDITPENIALGLRGTSSSIESGEVTDESVQAWAGARIALHHLPDPDETLTVTTDEETPTTLTEGDDYERTPHGIRIVDAPVNLTFTDEDTPVDLLVTYTRNPQHLIQALVSSGTEFEMIYHGLNEVDSANPITARYFRVKFSPTSGFQRHGGDEFAELTLSGTVLKDP
ncbi:MAG: hypothetical protein ACLFRJ_09995, partial [Ectothiorhodospira sp.]